jgi:secretion/DNA translocation related CpaE-like protein
VPPNPAQHRLSHAGSPAPRPLIVTGDPLLLDDLLRLAAAAGADAEVMPEAGAARRAWAAAPLVLVGADRAAEVARLGLPRRPGTVLVGRDLDDGGVWELAVGIGAEHVAFVPDGEVWIVERIADAVEAPGALATTVCVIGGRGGAGASTLSVALALTAMRRRLRCLLIDSDPLGGGLDLVLGREEQEGLRWPELAQAHGRVSGVALRDALPRVDALTVLSWDRGDLLAIAADAMRSVLGAGRRANDLIVVDLPRRPDAAAEEALAHADRTLLVVPAEVRATASAARVASAVAGLTADLQVVVRGPAPSGLSGELVAASLGLPLAGYLSPERGLAQALERGEPPARRGRGPLAEFCVALLDDLAPDVAA